MSSEFASLLIVNSTLIVKVHIPTNPKSRNPHLASRTSYQRNY